MMWKIAITFSDKDFDQLKLLARINNISVQELVRRLAKAHIDRNISLLRAET